MRSIAAKTLTLAAGICLIAAGSVFVSAPGSAQSGGPFASMAGTWSGNGRITSSSGNTERLRCRASYSVGSGGNSLTQDLRCASDSYRFELSTKVSHSGGRLSGTFQERSRNVFGNISGNINGGVIRARAESQSINAILNVTTKGNSQSVSIDAPGAEISNVAVTMKRG